MQRQPRGTGILPVNCAAGHGQDGPATAQGQDGPPTGQGQDRLATHALRIRKGAYLPHWTREGGIYAITFRLADSLPSAVVRAWKNERDEIFRRAEQQNRPLTALEQKELQRLFSSKVERYLDIGCGACWMRRPEIADLVERAIRHFDGQRYRLLAWCVMPNHVHTVVKPNPDHEVPQIVHSWKSYTAKKANRIIGRSGTFWQAEPYDHLIRDDDDLEHAITYTLSNPLTAGLKDWRWVGVASDIASILVARASCP